MSVTRNTIYNISGAGASVVVGLATVPLYLDQIGEARYGVLALVWLLLGYFGFFDLGLSRATANYIARLSTGPRSDQEAVFWTAAILNLILGIIGGLTLYFVGGPILLHWLKASVEIRNEAQQALVWIAAAVPIATSTAVMTGALSGQERFGAVNLIQVSGMVLFQVAPLVVAFAVGPQLDVVIPAAVLARCSVVVPLFLIVRKLLPLVRQPHFDRIKARELVSYGTWVSVTNMISPILSTFDRFVIGGLLGASSVAYYDVPSQLAAKMQILPGALSQALFPRLSVQSAHEAVITSAAAAGVINGIITPIVITALLLLNPFLTLWVGSEFARHAAPVGAALIVGVWISSVAAIPYTKLQAEGHPNWVASVHALEVLPYLVGLWWALRQFGLIGAGFVWTVRVTIDGVLLLALAKIWRKLLMQLFTSAILIVATFLLNDLTIGWKVFGATALIACSLWSAVRFNFIVQSFVRSLWKRCLT